MGFIFGQVFLNEGQPLKQVISGSVGYLAAKAFHRFLCVHKIDSFSSYG